MYNRVQFLSDVKKTKVIMSMQMVTSIMSNSNIKWKKDIYKKCATLIIKNLLMILHVFPSLFLEKKCHVEERSKNKN